MTDTRPLGYSYLRFSAMPQERGSSTDRQLERSTEYAAKHNLNLVRDYKDPGVSAAKGKNITEGKFSLFLKALEDGKIPRGSYLLVESIDRISRQESKKTALIILRIIVEHGIKI